MMVEPWKFASLIPGPIGESLDRHFAEQGWVLERRAVGDDTGYQVFFGEGVQVDNLHEYGFPYLYDKPMLLIFAKVFYERHICKRTEVQKPSTMFIDGGTL